MGIDPRLLCPRATGFDPKAISGLALWLDAADASSLYTTDAGPVTAVDSPLDVGGCVGWWDASDTGTITQSGGLVSQWNDKSGSGLHVSQATSGLQPGVATVNGRNAIDFDGTDDYLSTTSEPPVFAAMLCVHVCDVTNVGQALVAFGRGSGATFLIGSIQYTSVGEYATRFFSVTTGYNASGGSQSAGTPSLAVSSFSGSATSLRVRGAAETGTASVTGNNVLGAWFGTRNISGVFSLPLNGKLCEVLLFSSVPSASDLRRLEKYLADKWGVPAVHAQATVTSDPVGYWRDKSGSGRHMLQPTGSLRPTVGTQGSRRSIALNGTTQWMRQERTNYQRRGMFVVWRRTGTPANFSSPIGANNLTINAATLGGSGYSSSDAASITWYNSLTHYSANTASNKATALRYNAANIATADANNYLVGFRAAQDTTAVNLVYVETASSNAANWAHFVGLEPYDPARAYPCQMLEALFYNNTLTASQVTQIERYLAAKWGVALYVPPAYADADVNAYITAVEYADGYVTLETGVRDAINTFITGCKADGIWSAIKASCILAGARTLSGALTPLVGSAPTNVNNNFVSGDYNRKTGLVGNGSTKSITTNRLENADPQDNAHIAVWVASTATIGTTSYFRAGNTYGIEGLTAQDVSLHGAGAVLTGAITSGTLFGLSRSSAASVSARKNGTTSSLSSASSLPTSANIRVFARDNNTQYSNARLSFYSLGESIDLALLDARVSALMTAIGAAIP